MAKPAKLLENRKNFRGKGKRCSGDKETCSLKNRTQDAHGGLVPWGESRKTTAATPKESNPNQSRGGFNSEMRRPAGTTCEKGKRGAGIRQREQDRNVRKKNAKGTAPTSGHPTQLVRAKKSGTHAGALHESKKGRQITNNKKRVISRERGQKNAKIPRMTDTSS